jgi:hypothetical protein
MSCCALLGRSIEYDRRGLLQLAPRRYFLAIQTAKLGQSL